MHALPRWSDPEEEAVPEYSASIRDRRGLAETNDWWLADAVDFGWHTGWTTSSSFYTWSEAYFGFNTKILFFDIIGKPKPFVRSVGDVSTPKFGMTEKRLQILLPDLDRLTNSTRVAMKASDWPTGHLRWLRFILILSFLPPGQVQFRSNTAATFRRVKHKDFLLRRLSTH